MSIMGLPRQLTEKQMKFAELLVYNEGRKSASECAYEAGYKTRPRQAASELRNPKISPLVVSYIGELRREIQEKYDIDLGRQILGVRGISTPNLVEKMMNAAGQPYYKAIKFQGPAEIKNIMDGLAAPYFEVAAIKYLKKNPNYFDMPLKNKERVLDLMRADVRKDVTKMVQKGLPKEIDLVRVLSGKDKDKVREIMNELGLNMELEGLLQKEDGLQDLLRIKTLLDNYDDIFSDIVD